MNELLIIYQGEAALIRQQDEESRIPQELYHENVIIGQGGPLEKGMAIVAQSAKVKVLVLHKMFLKDTVFVSKTSIYVTYST
jgi:hypothetical protein